MSIFYFDSSVLVACYVPEKASSTAEAQIQKATGRVISDLTVVEMASAFSRKARDAVLAEADAWRAYELFQRHLTGGFYRRVFLEPRHYQAAARLILKVGSSISLRTLDALHAAAASLEGIRLCTSDETMARAGKSLGLDVVLVNGR